MADCDGQTGTPKYGRLFVNCKPGIICPVKSRPVITELCLPGGWKIWSPTIQIFRDMTCVERPYFRIFNTPGRYSNIFWSYDGYPFHFPTTFGTFMDSEFIETKVSYWQIENNDQIPLGTQVWHVTGHKNVSGFGFAIVEPLEEDNLWVVDGGSLHYNSCALGGCFIYDKTLMWPDYPEYKYYIYDTIMFGHWLPIAASDWANYDKFEPAGLYFYFPFSECEKIYDLSLEFVSVIPDSDFNKFEVSEDFYNSVEEWTPVKYKADSYPTTEGGDDPFEREETYYIIKQFNEFTVKLAKDIYWPAIAFSDNGGDSHEFAIVDEGEGDEETFEEKVKICRHPIYNDISEMPQGETPLEIVNQIRADYGCEPLEWCSKLNAISDAYAQRMIDTAWFAHEGTDGKRPWDRAEDYDKEFFEKQPTSENIAIALTFRKALWGLINSPGHWMNIIQPDWTHMGWGEATVVDPFVDVTDALHGMVVNRVPNGHKFFCQMFYKSYEIYGPTLPKYLDETIPCNTYGLLPSEIGKYFHNYKRTPIKYLTNELQAVHDTCIIEGEIVEIDRPNNQANIMTPKGIVIEDIPFHFHCDQTPDITNGHKAFVTGDEVLVLKKTHCNDMYQVIFTHKYNIFPCSSEFLVIRFRWGYLTWPDAVMDTSLENQDFGQASFSSAPEEYDTYLIWDLQKETVYDLSDFYTPALAMPTFKEWINFWLTSPDMVEIPVQDLWYSGEEFPYMGVADKKSFVDKESEYEWRNGEIGLPLNLSDEAGYGSHRGINLVSNPAHFEVVNCGVDDIMINRVDAIEGSDREAKKLVVNKSDRTTKTFLVAKDSSEEPEYETIKSNIRQEEIKQWTRYFYFSPGYYNSAIATKVNKKIKIRVDNANYIGVPDNGVYFGEFLQPYVTTDYSFGYTPVEWWNMDDSWPNIDYTYEGRQHIWDTGNRGNTDFIETVRTSSISDTGGDFTETPLPIENDEQTIFNYNADSLISNGVEPLVEEIKTETRTDYLKTIPEIELEEDIDKYETTHFFDYYTFMQDHMDNPPSMPDYPIVMKPEFWPSNLKSSNFADYKFKSLVYNWGAGIIYSFRKTVYSTNVENGEIIDYDFFLTETGSRDTYTHKTQDLSYGSPIGDSPVGSHFLLTSSSDRGVLYSSYVDPYQHVGAESFYSYDLVVNSKFMISINVMTCYKYKKVGELTHFTTHTDSDSVLFEVNPVAMDEIESRTVVKAGSRLLPLSITEDFFADKSFKVKRNKTLETVLEKAKERVLEKLETNGLKPKAVRLRGLSAPEDIKAYNWT